MRAYDTDKIDIVYCHQDGQWNAVSLDTFCDHTDIWIGKVVLNTWHCLMSEAIPSQSHVQFMMDLVQWLRYITETAHGVNKKPSSLGILCLQS